MQDLGHRGRIAGPDAGKLCSIAAMDRKGSTGQDHAQLRIVLEVRTGLRGELTGQCETLCLACMVALDHGDE